MKRPLLVLVITLCAAAFVHADETIRSLQQTLKEHGFYFGPVTGDKGDETTAAIRRYQIRKGLQITGELNEETLRSVESTSNSVAAASHPGSKPAASHPSTARPNVNARLSQTQLPQSFSEPDRPLKTIPSYSASFYQSAPGRLNRRIIAAAQYQLMSRGYYAGGVDGKYGRQTAFALRGFQSNAGLPATGRLDMETLQALGLSDAEFAYSAPASPGYETWMPVRTFNHGEWKLKWQRSHRPFYGDDRDRDRQVNSQSAWNRYNYDY